MIKARTWLTRGLLLAVSCVGPAMSAAPAGNPASILRVQGKEYWEVGDVGRRFGLVPQKAADNETVRLQSKWTRIDLDADSQVARINDLTVFLSDPVAADRGRFFVSRRDVEELIRPILSPRSTPAPGLVRTIVVDAGHGGNDHGNENSRLKLREKVYTLDVAQRLARELTASGFRVVMTRKGDRRVELEDRVALAERVKADLFVSIHFNSFTQPGVAGAETFVLTPRYALSTPAVEHDHSMRAAGFPGNDFDAWNAILGYKVHRELIDALGAPDRGLKRYRYFVLRMSPCPAVLVEAAFLSNDAEGRKVSTAAYRAQIARGIAAGVKAYAAAAEHSRATVAARRK